MDDVRRPIRHANEFWDHYGVVTHQPDGGDLVVFSRNGAFPTHIGIMVDEERYVHSPGIDDARVAVHGLAKSLIQPKMNHDRQLYRTNPIGFKALTMPSTHLTYRSHQQLIQ